ncbi:MAG: hypothetical protein MMC33_008048 [Icmadophila ericetorum]|nr:hypothetical protein [Icmadophila ericetorum]
MNAVRVRFTELIGTESVRCLICDFNWSNALVIAQFLDAVAESDHRWLTNLWDSQPQCREEIGQVLLLIIRALCLTGYKPEHDEFSALWMSSSGNLPKQVILKGKKHGWIRMLEDTEESCTMAVMVKKRLEPVSSGLSFLGCTAEWSPSSPSRLQTEICINRMVGSRKDLTEEWAHPSIISPSWDACNIWNVSKLQKDGRLWMSAPPGRLKILDVPTNDSLFVKRDRVTRNELLKFFGLAPGYRKGYWEHTDVYDKPLVQPIPLHVFAD